MHDQRSRNNNHYHLVMLVHHLEIINNRLFQIRPFANRNNSNNTRAQLICKFSSFILQQNFIYSIIEMFFIILFIQMLMLVIQLRMVDLIMHTFNHNHNNNNRNRQTQLNHIHKLVHDLLIIKSRKTINNN